MKNLLVLQIVLGSFFLINSQPIIAQTGIGGEWQIKLPNFIADSLFFDFRKDTIYHKNLMAPAFENYQVFELYKLSEDTIFFDREPIDPNFIGIGTYKYYFEGDSLKFELLREDCDYRLNLWPVISLYRSNLTSNSTITTFNLNVYPNPASDKLIVDNNSAAILSYKIINEIGLLEAQDRIVNDRTIIDISHLSDGIYFVSFIDENGQVHVEKIIKIAD